MSESYGLKATLTMVMNNDDYNVGFTFNDTKGSSLDKQFNGKIDNFEQDVTKALLEVYLDAMKKEKEKEKQHIANKMKGSIASNVVTRDKFAELEKENQRLNNKINDLLKQKEDKKTSFTTSFKEETPIVNNTTSVPIQYDNDIKTILRILGF